VLRSALDGTDLAEVAITSSATVIADEPPADSFRLDDVQGVGVVFAKAEGIRCARSWKITTDVGSDPEYPDLSVRDAKAMRERKAAGLAA
jgi:isoleucyl-tRNA synthetase